MRDLFVLACLAALLAALRSSAVEAVVPAGGGHVPVWALFSFAVSAFREPLR